MMGTMDRIRMGAAPISSPTSLAAPVGGWNTRDELDAMEPLDAVTLDNFFPDTSGITVRSGYLSWATGLGTDPVETLAEFRSGSSDKLLAACDDSIFEVTTSGAVGPALSTGFTNARWQTANFLSHMFLCNGADLVQIYDGATLANSAFSGVTTSTLIGVTCYQQRLFFWQANSATFYYALLNSISGLLSPYDLSAFLPQGGVITSITTVTHDGGNGVLDFVAFIMSSGDMLLFYGNDPSQSTTWQMIGRYRISPPVNIRSVCTYGADSFVATFDDYVPLQQQLVALKLGTLPPRSKISGAVQAAMTANRNGFGWQAIYYPKGRRLIFNVPNADGTFDQHVCNTALPSQPWCRFTGMNAYCWGLLGDSLYFGGADGTVYAADVAQQDLDLNPVQATAQQAWNRLNNANRKRIVAVRPVVSTLQGVYSFGVGFDFIDPEPEVLPSLVGPEITDDANTPITDDAGNAIDAGAESITVGWAGAAGSGTSFSLLLQVSAAAPMSWLRTDFRGEIGNAL